MGTYDLRTIGFVPATTPDGKEWPSAVRHLITNDYMGVRKLRLIFNAAHGALAVGTIPSAELSAFQAFQLRKRHALATTWHALKNSPYAVLRNFIRAWLKVVKRNTEIGRAHV